MQTFSLLRQLPHSHQEIEDDFSELTDSPNRHGKAGLSCTACIEGNRTLAGSSSNIVQAAICTHVWISGCCNSPQSGGQEQTCLYRICTICLAARGRVCHCTQRVAIGVVAQPRTTPLRLQYKGTPRLAVRYMSALVQRCIFCLCCQTGFRIHDIDGWVGYRLLTGFSCLQQGTTVQVLAGPSSFDPAGWGTHLGPNVALVCVSERV